MCHPTVLIGWWFNGVGKPSLPRKDSARFTLREKGGFHKVVVVPASICVELQLWGVREHILLEGVSLATAGCMCAGAHFIWRSDAQQSISGNVRIEEGLANFARNFYYVCRFHLGAG